MIAQVIADRTNEIGVRVVLGAAPRQVLAAVGAHGLRPAAIGVVVGLLAGLGVGRALAAFLYGVPSLNVVVLGGVAGVVVVVALVATYLGARRALSVSPMDALRSS